MPFALGRNVSGAMGLTLEPLPPVASTLTSGTGTPGRLLDGPARGAERARRAHRPSPGTKPLCLRSQRPQRPSGGRPDCRAGRFWRSIRQLILAKLSDQCLERLLTVASPTKQVPQPRPDASARPGRQPVHHEPQLLRTGQGGPFPHPEVSYPFAEDRILVL
jgi:hypothetical protein